MYHCVTFAFYNTKCMGQKPVCQKTWALCYSTSTILTTVDCNSSDARRKVSVYLLGRVTKYQVELWETQLTLLTNYHFCSNSRIPGSLNEKTCNFTRSIWPVYWIGSARWGTGSCTRIRKHDKLGLCRRSNVWKTVLETFACQENKDLGAVGIVSFNPEISQGLPNYNFL